jgi:hypothetical protein
MKPTRNSPDLPPTLAFGAHPDDIEFGFGGVAATEMRAKRRVHFVVCSSGESGTNGTPKQRMAEAKNPPGCSVQRLNSLSWPVMRTLKFAFPTPFDWQKS